ncbi:helix-turn-helix transcriptional regulator [Verrucosispora sp. WMMC514]|uniref:helix-turn-helix domain-containing protein n=1 Tax=Verrucosispora sp. WMMC514 TaxID=3015156 RepID=UPI00248D0BE9|nr:helix-turn-helix transcriptional regulator [Verrucosispora sp. WMMC514]WBB93348.1 helix-turn-helix transcriptional regulator [Verrucosispora sp. WMMC514]
MTTTPDPDVGRLGDSTLLSDRLKKTREYLNFSQQWVSERTGIPRSAISEIERGARRVDSLELKKLARLYRYPVSYFLDEDLDAIPAEHAVAGLPRRLTNLKPEDLNQVMRFAQFLEMSYQADAEGDGQDEHPVPQRRGASS